MRRPSASPSFLTLLLFPTLIIANLFVCCICEVNKHLKLKSRYKRRIEVAIEYAKTIDDFDDLVDPRTLARHYLGPEPSSYVLHAIKIEEKSKCSFASLLTWILFSSFFFTSVFLPQR